MTKKSLEKIQEVFIANFGHLHIKFLKTICSIAGKVPCHTEVVGSFIFLAKKGGREYFEYYAHHWIGEDGHGKIYEDGESVSLSTLESMFAYNRKIPDDRELKEAENAEEYRQTIDGLNAKGMFSSGTIPGALVINSYIMAEESNKGKKADNE